MVTAIRKMKGGEGDRSPRGGTTEATEPQPTDVPEWVEFPSKPDLTLSQKKPIAGASRLE